MAGIALLAAAAAALALCVAGPAFAGGLKVRRGVYDCYQSDLSGMHYVNSIKVGRHGKYALADDRHGRHLVGPTLRGKYRTHGRYVLWRSGVLHKEHVKGEAFTSSVITPHLYFKMISTQSGEPTGVSCDLIAA